MKEILFGNGMSFIYFCAIVVVIGLTIEIIYERNPKYWDGVHKRFIKEFFNRG